MRFQKLFLIICILVFLCTGCSDLLGHFEQMKSPLPEEKEDPNKVFFGEEVADETVKENIFSALNDVDITTRFISDFKKIEDGEMGERYSFVYQENLFIVTMDSDSTVYSVRVGEDGEDVYLKGYEPYAAEDYIITESRIQGFRHMMENAVEISFDYPAVYEFGDDWTYKHEADFYYTGGSVLIGEAKEAHYISLVYYYEEAENTLHWYSLNVDGNEMSIERVFEEPEIPERQKISGD